MSLVVGDGIGKVHPGRVIFRDLSFRLEAGDRVGLIGVNGAGKSTLMRIIAGMEEPSDGGVQRKRGLRISYLPQEPPTTADVTLSEAVHAPFDALRRMEGELHRLAEEMGHASDPGASLERYAALQHDFEARGGYTFEARVQSVLSGLGFQPEDHARPLAHLSGGQRTRALLARILLEDPELLLLDEPTNHLDLDAIEWVEAWLRDFPGALLVVSHDRAFLEATANRTWDLSFGALEAYPVGYRDFVRVRAERQKERDRVWEAQQEFIRRTEDFIARNLAGQRSREAKGRRTRLQRFLETEAVERTQEHATIDMRLGGVKRSGDRVLAARDLVIGYEPGRPLASVPELEVWRGQRVGILGPNGQGKTTLLKTLRGEIPPLDGAVRCGASVEIGYLSQAHEEMDPEASVLDTVLAVRGERTIEQVRTILGAYLFRGEDVFKRLRELSVGQKSRVALCWLSMQGVNTLVLDEPTNHLDLGSQEELQSVLTAFPGTILFVTHDRSLAQALATEVWVVADGRVQVVPGGWDSYRAWRENGKARAEAARTATRSAGQSSAEALREEGRRKRERERMKTRHAEIEADIPRLEARLKELSREIDRAGERRDMDALGQLCSEYQSVAGELKPLWDEWAKLTEALEA